MFPFSRKKSLEHKSGEDKTVNASDILGEELNSEEEEEGIDTELSFHPDWEIPNEQRYVYAFHNSEAPALKPNQLSLSGIDIEKQGRNVICTAFIRQSLDKPIQLKETAILLLGPNNEQIARKTFDLSQVGTIPAKSSRPWQFIFQPENLYTDMIPSEGWSLAFELRPSSRKHELDLDEAWKQSLADGAVRQLEEVVANAAPLKPGEVNFMGISAKRTEEADLAITILIRNGADKNIKLEQLPLKVEDASGEVVAQGSFTLTDFEIKANTSKPWTFVFPASLVQKEELDLSKWKVYPVQ
ncbi:accessory Sec system S-layer assembly protein [Radiobacillus deserti]|uniref:Accessory Sec system S-layer assembly protein n=1 Tax=Radiobacillus deserti TaxID=2594883 RepID=A0A516KJA5_9BACI|nr:accessory Sec system S-layer assembly protein [Radiobacillus deserti]QDP41480.1 accessory Sec system S-layer assembly protein [Radiobacillus deserti]